MTEDIKDKKEIVKNPQVFVCHASEDKERFVLLFATKLRGKGIDAWLDKWEMNLGSSLVDKIFEEGIGHTQAFIIVLSKFSVNKPWVREELNAAVVKRIEKGTKIIPVVIDDCDIPEALKSTLWVRIKDLNNYENELEGIVNAIYEHIDKPALGNPPIYAQTVVDKIYGLTKTDTIIFKLACEKAIENEHSLIMTKELATKVENLGISHQDFFDSLQILAGKHYFDLDEALGGDIFGFSITHYGFEQYALKFISAYNSIIKEVISRIVNNQERDTGIIATSLKQPIMLINHICDTFTMKGLIKVSKSSGSFGNTIFNISPEMKRLLEKT